jgi:hypothetical protein
MDSEDRDLNPEKILYAVKNMSYVGLQYVAVYGLLLLAKYKSPAEICQDIENLGGENGNLCRRSACGESSKPHTREEAPLVE